MRFRHLASASLAAAAALLLAPGAQAADAPIPSSKSCSTVDGAVYACLAVADQRVPSGETATFTGTLSPTAMRNLAKWTKGDDIVCLTRAKTKPEADGWPNATLEGACTTVRKDGGFTINAELGRKGTFYYGVIMGPCRGSAALCGGGDPGLVTPGGSKKVVSLTTT